MRQLIPLYTWHGDNATWEERLSTVRPGDYTIINPSTGPDPDDLAERQGVHHRITSARASRAIVLGYIHCNYGNRPWADLAKNADTWQRTHGVDRFFLDETPAPTTRNTYRWLRELSPAARGNCVANPGVRTTIRTPGLIIVTHEGPDLPQFDPQPHEAALVYGQPPGTRLPAAWRTGYVTHDVPPNPWDGVA